MWAASVLVIRENGRGVGVGVEREGVEGRGLCCVCVGRKNERGGEGVVAVGEGIDFGAVTTSRHSHITSGSSSSA